MPVVTLCIDLDALWEQSPTDVLVERIEQYPVAYALLQEAITSGKPCSLCVRHQSVAAWLVRAAATYGESLIALHYYTPRAALAARWRVPIPLQVTDQEILQDKLLDLAVTAREGQSFWNLMLEYRYGSVATSPVFPHAQFASLLNRVHETTQSGQGNYVLAKRALEAQLALWSQTESRAMCTLLHALAQSPQQLRRDLTWYKLLRHYPASLGQKVLGERWEIYQQATIDLEDMLLLPADLEGVIPDIEYYLSAATKQVTTQEDCEHLLSCMSGLLLEEFRALLALLATHMQWLTPSFVQRITEHFRALQGSIEEDLARLSRLIEPPFPEEPQASWSLQEWLSWVRDQYMPYYSWLLEVPAQAQQTRLATLAFQFADWLDAHYLECKYNAREHFAFHALYDDRHHLQAEGIVTLVLLLDSMNFVYFPDLRRLFAQHHFVLQGAHARPVLAALPTSTELGKGAIIAASLDQIAWPSGSYRHMMEATWSPILPGKRLAYVESIGELQELHEQTADVYFLNYLAIDRILHEDSRESGVAHAEQVVSLLKALVTTIVAFATRLHITARLQIYCLADHGSTRIAHHVVNGLEKRFFSSLAHNAHHRFLALSDEEFSHLPQVVHTQCYLIDRERFKTRKNYLAARQYYRFTTTNEHFSVHGGLTPEEAVVPFARFVYASTPPQMPSLRLLTQQIRYAVHSRVQLEIGNPNPASLEALSFRLLDTDAESVFVAQLLPKHSQQIAFPILFPKVMGQPPKQVLTIRMSYQYEGTPFGPYDQTVEIAMKSLMEVTDDPFDL